MGAQKCLFLIRILHTGVQIVKFLKLSRGRNFTKFFKFFIFTTGFWRVRVHFVSSMFISSLTVNQLKW